jgi:hypothetical protein
MSAFEDDLSPVLEVHVHVPIAVRPERAGKFGVAVGEGDIEGGTVLVEVSDFSDTADTVGRHLLDNSCDSVVQLCNAEDLSRVVFRCLPLSIRSVRHALS